MRFKRWLNEAINVPPHLPQVWWKNTLDKAKSLEEKISGKEELFKNLRELARHTYSIDTPYEVYNYVPYELRNLFSGNSYSNQTLSQRMEEYDQVVKVPNITAHTANNYLYRTDIISQSPGLTKSLQQFIEKYSDYFRRDKRYSEELEEIENAKEENWEDHYRMMQQGKEVVDAVFEYIKLLKDVKKNISAIKDRMVHSFTYDKDKTLPFQTKEFEILYHATPFVKEILREGFKTKEQLGNKEVLGGATDGAISFTADIRIARAIAHSIKDAINIAQGKMGIADVVRMAKADNVDIKNAFGDWSRGMKLTTLKKNIVKGTAQKPMWMYGDQDKLNDYDDMRHKVFDLYKTYLAHTKMRYNPLFFGVDYKQFENLDVNNVGVIACRCEIKKSKKYLTGMEEFRIPVDGIQVLKVVK